MSLAPVLLIGGSGAVGGWAARHLRSAHPDLPLLIGGRDLAKAQKAAAEIGRAEGVSLDLADDSLGLGERQVSAVAIFPKDDTIASLRFAQARGVAHISIAQGLNEIGLEVAAYTHARDAAPVVLGTEWLVGATTIPTLEFAKAFGRIDAISIGALLDDEDTGGPETADALIGIAKEVPVALTRRDGIFFWRTGDDARTSFRAADGTPMKASALSPYDVVSLATATGAPNVQFNLARGVSSTRRRGEPMSTEIVIELAGDDHAGKPLRTRHAVVHPQGQIPVTGLGVALVLERLIGLGGHPATPAGLYFPHQLLDPETYFARFAEAGGAILKLDD